MKTKYVVCRFILDQDDYKSSMFQLANNDQRLQWLSARGIETEIESVYDVSIMCYHVYIKAEFDRETYIEYKMVWE